MERQKLARVVTGRMLLIVVILTFFCAAPALTAATEQGGPQGMGGKVLPRPNDTCTYVWIPFFNVWACVNLPLP